MEKRRHRLKQYHQLLNTEQGQEMMAELKAAWGTIGVLHESPQHMGFNAGLLEAYRQLEFWQRGEGLENE